MFMRVEEFRKYSDAEIKHLQEVELMILKDVVKILDEHNLNYYMYGGSLLGTIRHGGFIPWDDDIDIILFRDEFDKALEILYNNLPSKYELIQMDYIDDCFAYFAKVSLKNTTFGRWYSSYVDYNLGINIDIFVLDNIPNSDFLGKLHHKCYTFFYQFVINSCIRMDMYSELGTKLHHLVHDILDRLPISRRTWKRLLTKEITFFNNKETEKVTDCFNLAGFMAYQRDDFEPAIKVPFEDFEVTIPKNYDKLLTQIYGDYMKIPPKEDRYNAAPEILDFGEY